MPTHARSAQRLRVPYRRRELASDDHPRAVTGPARASDEQLAGIQVAIIGDGVGGPAMAVTLEQLGIPYTVYERQDDIGGVWSPTDTQRSGSI
jgi:NADPH-dependent glutamate synthase beta subunit-like oxidoreductase